jgi:electron transfer flavoprotein alpha subunit
MMMLSRTAAAATPTLRRFVASSSSRLASTLVVSEPLTEGGVTPPGTQSTVTAAQQFGQEVDLLVVGDQPPTQIPAGVSKVYHVAIGDRLAESVANAIETVAKTKDCNIVVGTSSKYGSTVIPRAAALLDASPITDILEIQDASTYKQTIDSIETREENARVVTHSHQYVLFCIIVT